MISSLQREEGEVICMPAQAKIHRHHFLPTTFTIPEQDNHEPFEEVFYDTNDFHLLSQKFWVIGRHFLCTDRWLWKLKLGTKYEQHAFETLVYTEHTFGTKASMEAFVTKTYPQLIHFDKMTPYCTLRVNRYLLDLHDNCWVDVCSWEHKGKSFFYVVGTENASLSSTSFPHIDGAPAPSKFMAVILKCLPIRLSQFSSFEVELAKNSSLISEKFPTKLLPRWDSEDDYYYDKRSLETDETDW